MDIKTLEEKFNQELALKEFAVETKDNHYRGYFYGIHPVLGFQSKEEIDAFEDHLLNAGE